MYIIFLAKAVIDQRRKSALYSSRSRFYDSCVRKKKKGFGPHQHEIHLDIEPTNMASTTMLRTVTFDHSKLAGQLDPN